MTHGAMTPLFVVVEDLETGATSRHAFIKSPVRIGRSELNDLPLPLPFVSGWHAVVQFDEGSVTYVDLGSTNGSLLDGGRLERNVPAEIRGESEIRIGTLRLQFGRRGVVPDAAAQKPVTSFSLRVSELHLPAAPPPPAPGPQAELSADEQGLVEQALANAALDLDLSYASYRGAWEHLCGLVDQTLLGISGPARTAALAQLAAKYEALAREPQFRERSGLPPQTTAAAPEPAAPRGPTTDLVSAFGRAYLPVQAARAEPQELLSRTAELLETFGKSYLELRKGYEEFGREMGVSAVRNEGAVARARDPKELLAWLLDLRAEGRPAELQRAFADLMVHQVALLNGVVEGARAILTRLSPDEVAASSRRAVFHTKATDHWKEFEERWHTLADEEDGISAALFGPEFARAYTAVVGGRVPPPGDDDRAT